MAVSEEMVERGARGITSFLSDGDGGPRFDDLSRKNQEAALDTARACLTAALSDQVVVPKNDMVLHPLSEIREWDEALAVLGIQDSNQAPAEAIRELNAEIERLRARASIKGEG